MTPYAVQEAGDVVLNGFFAELDKTAFFGLRRVPKGSAAEGLLNAGKAIDEHASVVIEADKLHEKTKVLKETAGKGIEDAQAKLNGMPASKRTIAEVEAAKKKNNNLALSAGALGLSGLGFGYYQYKKNQDDQLGRAYPQVG